MPAHSIRTWKLCQKQLIDQVRTGKSVTLSPIWKLTVVQKRLNALRQSAYVFRFALPYNQNTPVFLL